MRPAAAAPSGSLRLALFGVPETLSSAWISVGRNLGRKFGRTLLSAVWRDLGTLKNANRSGPEGAIFYTFSLKNFRVAEMSIKKSQKFKREILF